MSFTIVNGREVGKKIDELLTAFAFIYVISTIVDAAVELEIEPLKKLAKDFIIGIFD